MNAKPTLARAPFLPCFIGALLSAVVTAVLLGAVSGLFQSDGIPFGRVVAAERTCQHNAFVSEREACVRRELAGPISAMIASGPCAPEGDDVARVEATELLLDVATKRVGSFASSRCSKAQNLR